LALWTGVALPERCRVEHEMIQKQTMLVQQLLLSAAANDATDQTICMCAVSYSCRIQRNEGMIGPACNTLEVLAVILWCRLVVCYLYFGTTWQPYLQQSNFVDCMPFENGTDMLSQNVCNELPSYDTQYFRRVRTSTTPWEKPAVSHIIM